MNSQDPKPGRWKLLRIWTGIGLQSFGGGASTSFLIYQNFVEKYNWLLPEEYTLYWNLSIMAPGTSIVGMTILIGRKLGGIRGIAASLIGLLLPSAAITCLLTAGFLSVAHFPATQAMLRGVVPVTAGITLVVGLKYAQPLVKASKAEGLPCLLLSLLLALAALLALTIFHLPVPLLLPGAALLGVLLFTKPVSRPAIGLSRQAREKQPVQAKKEEIRD